LYTDNITTRHWSEYINTIVEVLEELIMRAFHVNAAHKRHAAVVKINKICLHVEDTQGAS